MNELIVADAGPLIALGRIDALGVLAQVRRRVIVPRVVSLEYAIRIADAFQRGWLFAQPDIPVLPGLQIATLGDGESAAIELAEALDAPLLIDERRGRTIARERGLHVIGTVAILIAARRREIIPALAPLLSALVDGGYYVSDALIDAALASVGEL